SLLAPATAANAAGCYANTCTDKNPYDYGCADGAIQLDATTLTNPTTLEKYTVYLMYSVTCHAAYASAFPYDFYPADGWKVVGATTYNGSDLPSENNSFGVPETRMVSANLYTRACIWLDLPSGGTWVISCTERHLGMPGDNSLGPGCPQYNTGHAD